MGLEYAWLGMSPPPSNLSHFWLRVLTLELIINCDFAFILFLFIYFILMDRCISVYRCSQETRTKTIS